MERTIVGFHQDADGAWVAELDCGHRQHIRHRPPFEQRPWVLSAASRAERIGTSRDCPLCDGGEPACKAALVCPECGGLDGHRDGCPLGP
jgi:hypothetical protein